MTAPHSAPADAPAAIDSGPDAANNAAPKPKDAKAASGTAMALGEFLATMRQAKGLTLEAVRLATKVKTVHLEAIEKGDRAALPATPYAAGFVKAYAQLLDLDPEEMAARFRAETLGRASPDEERATAPQPPKTAPALLIGQAIETAPAPTAPDAPSRNITFAPDRFTLFAGAAAILLCALIIGVAVSARQQASATAEASSAGAAPHTPAPQAAPARIFAEITPADNSQAIETDEPATPGQSQTPAVEPEIATAPARASAVHEAADPAPAPQDTPASEANQPQIAAAEAQPKPAPAATAPAESPAPTLAPALPEKKIKAARLVNAPAARFPTRCRARRGEIINVAVIFDITAEGRPAGAKIAESDDDCFNAAAISAANRMRFEPRTIDGAPAKETAKRVTIRFKG